MSKRTDCHRPAAIIPAHYEYVFSYNCATTCGGWPVPSYGVNCELDRRKFDKDGKIVANGEHNADGHCCVMGLLYVAKVQFVETGTTGQCSICGHAYIYGDVWKHTISGDYLHVGHNCADKYRMLADRTEYELKLEHLKAMAAREAQKALNAKDRAEFLAKHPGLEEALKTDHHIVKSICENFQRFCSLTEKQIALVMKLYNEAQNPKEQEKFVPAPEGRLSVTGEVVSVKSYESAYGTQMKMTVKVQTEQGVWLAWGTAPDCLLGNGLRGHKISFTATFSKGRDAHFALFKRPTKAVVVQ